MVKFNKFNLKHTLLIVCLLMATNIVAQQNAPVRNLAGTTSNGVATLTWETPLNLIFSENFENGIPSSWQNIDSDGDGHLWMPAPDGNPHSGNGMATSESFSLGNLSPDNWLISNAITLSGTPNLVYYVNAHNSAWAGEHYGVYISTTGNNPSDFTLLFEETMTGKGNTDNRNNRDQGAWYERAIDLTTYSGTVYLAWHHYNCSGMERLNLDDIAIDCGQPLTTLTGYKVYRENELLATLDASTLTYVDPEMIVGTSSYCVTATYTDGESEPFCISLDFQGPCNLVQNLTGVANNDGTVTLNWEAPERNVEGYKIYRDGSYVKTLSNNALSFNDLTAYNGSHEYCVIVVYDLCVSDPACVTVEVNSSNNCEYTVIMHKNMGPTGIGGWEGAAIRFYNMEGNMLFTCTLEDGSSAETVIGFPQEDIECVWSSGADDSWINFEIEDPLGNEIFRCWPDSLTNQSFLTFTSFCTQDAPAMPENLTVNGSDNSLEALLSWINPSTTQSGNPTTLTSVVVKRNDETVHTIDNPTAGATESWTDENVPLPGIYTYSVYAVNESGNSSSATATGTIGLYKRLPVSGTETIKTCVGYIVSEGDNLGLYPANYDGILTITPEEDNHLVKLTGTHYIYGGEMGGDADHLYIYDGIGTAGTLLADYSASCFDKGSVNVTSLTGSLTIHMKANGMGGCRGFEIYSECILNDAVNELNNKDLNIYPNPADNQIVIENEDVETVILMDIYGRVVRQTSDNVINTSEIENGIYILNVKLNNGIVINKNVVVIH